MKRKIILILTILSVCLLTFASQGHAYMGSSTNYKLDIADQTNSGASGSSSGYSLTTGITGDHFDGTGQSANYHLCAGFAEESLNNSHCGSALPGTLNIIVHVINDSGGTLVAGNFTFHVKSGGVDVAGSPSAGAEAPGIPFALAAGPYAVSINPTAGYTTTISGSCAAGGAVILPAGAVLTCTITADDIAPPPPPPPPPPACSGCGPGWPPIEETQIIIPTQEIPQYTQIVIPQPGTPSAPPETIEVIPPEGFPSPEYPYIPSAPEPAPAAAQPKELLSGVWCAENACFDQPVVILKPAAIETTYTGGQIYIVRPWIIWLVILLLLLVIILFALYIDAKMKESGTSMRHSWIFPVKTGRRKK